LYFLQGVEYAVAFRRLDVNCDGRIDREELGKGKQVLLRWKIDPEKYESLLEEARKEAPIGFARFAQWLEEMENFDMEAEEVGAAE
jgi:Ca2+-binding EF-hand superfamily protein